VRVCIAVPGDGLGQQLAVMRAWLDAICGAGGWAAAPAGFGGIVNNAIAFYFADPGAARAFVNRFCCGYNVIDGASSHIIGNRRRPSN
jgi:hypothetical protein